MISAEENGVEPIVFGFWSTLLLGVLVLVTFTAIQYVVSIPVANALYDANPEMDVEELTQLIEYDGGLVSIATIATGVFCPLLIVFFVNLFGRMTVSDYLGLKRVSFKTVLIWLAGVLCFILASDELARVLGHKVVPDFMSAVYSSANPFILVIAMVVGAPLFEEFFFRGFLFKGWSQSRLGVVGTIVLTSALWAVIHLQYEIYYVGIIFIMGLLFGFARHRTGSLYVPLAMHALCNFVATIQTAIVVSG